MATVTDPHQVDLQERRRRGVTLITVTLLLLTVVHDIDHVRQGRTLDIELYGVALAALTMPSVTLVLLLRRNFFAPVAAAAAGLSTVLGVAAVHVAPSHVLLSDSYSAAHADALSWVIIILMMLAGLSMAVVALRWLRASDGRAWT